MFQRTQLVTEHALLAFPDGRQAVPRAVICKSDVLKRIVGVPAAQAVVAALLPRRALQLWSLHVQRQAQQDNSIDDLCTVVRVCLMPCPDLNCRVIVSGLVYKQTSSSLSLHSLANVAFNHIQLLHWTLGVGCVACIDASSDAVQHSSSGLTVRWCQSRLLYEHMPKMSEPACTGVSTD